MYAHGASSESPVQHFSTGAADSQSPNGGIIDTTASDTTTSDTTAADTVSSDSVHTDTVHTDTVNTDTTAVDTVTIDTVTTDTTGTDTSVVSDTTRSDTTVSDTVVQVNPGILMFKQETHTVSEADGNIILSVIRTNGSDGQVTVGYSISPGTVLAGEDFLQGGGVLVFEDGEVSESITVTVYDDNVLEADETIYIALMVPDGGASLGSITNAALILTSDEHPVVDDVPWIEDFSLPNHTTLDTGPTKWSLAGFPTGYYGVLDSTLRAVETNAIITWTSEPINISAGPVDVSMDGNRGRC